LYLVWRCVMKTRTRWLSGLLWLFLSCVGVSAWATDDPPGRVGRVAEISGTGWMRQAQGGEWFALMRNRPFTTGDKLSTERDGQLELQIGSTTVLMGAQTEVQVSRLDDERVELLVQHGMLAVRLREPEQIREWRLLTPEGFVEPHSTGLFRLDRSERGTVLMVLSGELGFGSPDSTLTLTRGQRAEFWQDSTDKRTHYQWVSRPEDSFDRSAQALVAELPPVLAGTVSPEMTGVRDLDRYGRWDTHPEYGRIWQPATVQPGWAPYRFGHWAWISPWGWTWVDDAPWGFAPFHYGRWVLWQGSWCWAPGQYVARPVWAPALVVWAAPPPPPPRFVVIGRPAVGWVPLAPRDPYQPVYPASYGYTRNLNVTYAHPALQAPQPEQPLQPPQPRPPVTVPRQPVEPVMSGPRMQMQRIAPNPQAPQAVPNMPSAPNVPRAEPAPQRRFGSDIRTHPGLVRPAGREPGQPGQSGGPVPRRDPRGGND
jgi:hypothetical protein